MFVLLVLCILNLCSLKFRQEGFYYSQSSSLLNKENSMVIDWRIKNDKLCVSKWRHHYCTKPVCLTPSILGISVSQPSPILCETGPRWPHTPHRNTWRLVCVQLALLMRPSYTNTHLNSTLLLMSVSFFFQDFESTLITSSYQSFEEQVERSKPFSLCFPYINYL